MKSVFEASLGIEAHMIKNLLAMNDVESEIFGEHLQGGIGDLQPGGIIRVMVADEDYPTAHKIVADWEASQPPINYEDEGRKTSSYGSALLGFIVGAIIVLVLTQTPITYDGVDYNGDGVLDEQLEYAGGLVREIKIDRNRDGKFDVLWRNDMKGLLKSSSFDNDFDGRFEFKCRFKAGNTVWCRGDYDNDGFAEYREGYNSGVHETASMFDPASKAIKKKQYFVGGVLKRAEVDLDGDGVLETNYTYDVYAEIQE